MKHGCTTHRLRILPALVAFFALVALALPITSNAQTFQSTSLTDKIHRGDGTINLLKDISSSSLSSYFNQTGRLLLLGVDLNEKNSGNESSTANGVAIKDAQLRITTTAGEFTFKDFFTSTSASLREGGAGTFSNYATLFGNTGSAPISGGQIDASKFDDVMWFENINFTGDITSAQMSVQFLDTGKDSKKNPLTGSEKFFDFSAGFEDFALLSAADAILAENARNGMGAIPADVVFAPQGTAVDAIASATAGGGTGGGAGGGGDTPGGTGGGDTGGGTGGGTGSGDTGGGTGGGDTGGGTGGGTGTGGGGDVVTPPAAPMPPFVAVALLAALLLWKQRKSLRLQNA